MTYWKVFIMTYKIKSVDEMELYRSLFQICEFDFLKCMLWFGEMWKTTNVEYTDKLWTDYIEKRLLDK